MLQDRILVWKLKKTSAKALSLIYEKYRDDLLRLALSLSNDTSLAEDAVHDVFAAFILGAKQFKLSGSLKSYLAKCVANRVRNINRDSKRRQNAALDEASQIASDSKRPDQWIISSEQLKRIASALALLSYDQREVITLHLQGGMKFREIAEFQDVPLKTALSRYRCGLIKLRSLLNGEVAQCDQ